MTPIDQLRATKEKLPPELRGQILALRAEAVPPLIAILTDAQLGMSESPAEGWPPIHAVELLADLKATEAIEPMLDVLVETCSTKPFATSATSRPVPVLGPRSGEPNAPEPSEFARNDAIDARLDGAVDVARMPLEPLAQCAWAHIEEGCRRAQAVPPFRDQVRSSAHCAALRVRSDTRKSSVTMDSTLPCSATALRTLAATVDTAEGVKANRGTTTFPKGENARTKASTLTT